MFYMGFSINGGTPIAGWFIMENTKHKLMIGGIPLFQENPHIILWGNSKVTLHDFPLANS